MRFGYKASAEQFGPRELLEFSVLAEQVGFDTIAVSDHFQPWRHNTGHAPSALVWLGALGQVTERATMVTSVARRQPSATTRRSSLRRSARSESSTPAE